MYFSPKDKSATRIVQLIKEAKTYIYIPAFLITHTNIANELMRLASRECYGSSSLEDALKGIHFDAGEYTGSVPLDVDGFEPTAEEP